MLFKTPKESRTVHTFCREASAWFAHPAARSKIEKTCRSCANLAWTFVCLEDSNWWRQMIRYLFIVQLCSFELVFSGIFFWEFWRNAADVKEEEVHAYKTAYLALVPRTQMYRGRWFVVAYVCACPHLLWDLSSTQHRRGWELCFPDRMWIAV